MVNGDAAVVSNAMRREAERSEAASSASAVRPASLRRPIRVLHTLSGLHVAGIGRMLLRNIAALESDRVQNYVAYLTPDRVLEPQYREAGFEPICLDHRTTSHGPRTLYRLVQLIRELDVDVVHTNHSLDRLYGGAAARIAGVPAVTTAHDTGRYYATGGRLRKWLERRLLSQYIAVSGAVAQAYERSRNVPADRIRVTYSGIDLLKFAPAPSAESVSSLCAELGLHDAYPVLINVARLHTVKGQKYLVPMMSNLLPRWPRAKLLLVGEGALRSTLEASIARGGLGESIKLLGLRSDVRTLLALSTLFIFPSLEEGLPIAVIEAMGAAKPVVAARVGPMAEMVEDEKSGLLVSPKDPVALACAVERLSSSPELALRMGQRGQQIVAERFSIKTTVRSMEDLYRGVLR
jgi:glycosyltransferase involved in cell wall biosynthesis